MVYSGPCAEESWTVFKSVGRLSTILSQEEVSSLVMSIISLTSDFLVKCLFFFHSFSSEFNEKEE